jgi:hypothetical protein
VAVEEAHSALGRATRDRDPDVVCPADNRSRAAGELCRDPRRPTSAPSLGSRPGNGFAASVVSKMLRARAAVGLKQTRVSRH